MWFRVSDVLIVVGCMVVIGLAMVGVMAPVLALLEGAIQ